MAILVGLLVLVVVGWILLGALILPQTAGALAGRWTRTPDAPMATTLEFDGRTWRLDGALEYTGTGTAEVDGSQLVLSADPACPDDVGRYTIEVRSIARFGLLPENTSEELSLETVDDPCADGARRAALESAAWVLRASGREGIYGICDPPNEEAAITGHWPEPSGCSG
jgi:hypothetical protein